MKHSFLIAVAVALLTSCIASRKLTYLRDMEADCSVAMPVPMAVTLLPGDKITVVVSSRDNKLSDLFNLSDASVIMTRDNGTALLRGNALPYTVDDAGYIDFPVMGKLHVGGLTRDSVAKFVKQQLFDRGLLADAVVYVEFANLGVTVLGEVRAPGRIPFNDDRLTLLEAIGLAGDLTSNGDRSNVLVMRHEGNASHAYRIDLRSAESVYSSPAYYLRQGDVVYVEPRRAKRGK